MARAASSGTRVGIATGAGIAAGDVVHTSMAIVGLSAIIATSALLFSVVKYAGAAFLIYLGIRAMLDKTPIEVNGGAPAISAARAFRQAVLTEVLNPKTALFFLAFLPQFVRPETRLADASARGRSASVFVLLGLVSTVVFAVGAGRLGNFLRRHPAVVKWQGKVVGTIYCAVLAFRLALQER